MTLRMVVSQIRILKRINFVSFFLLLIIIAGVFFMKINNIQMGLILRFEIFSVLAIIIMFSIFFVHHKRKELKKLFCEIDMKNVVVNRIVEANMPTQFFVTITKMHNDKMYYWNKELKKWYWEGFAQFIDKNIFYFYKNFTLPINSKIRIYKIEDKHLLVETSLDKGFISADAIVVLEKE